MSLYILLGFQKLVSTVDLYALILTKPRLVSAEFNPLVNVAKGYLVVSAEKSIQVLVAKLKKYSFCVSLQLVSFRVKCVF